MFARVARIIATSLIKRSCLVVLFGSCQRPCPLFYTKDISETFCVQPMTLAIFSTSNVLKMSGSSLGASGCPYRNQRSSAQNLSETPASSSDPVSYKPTGDHMAASSVSGAPPHVSPFDQQRKSDTATTSQPPPLTAKDPAGFAYKTVRERLAVILTRTMDTASNDVATMEPDACEDMNLVAERLTKLRDEIAANKALVALEDDFENATVWNAVLDEYTAEGKGDPPHWYDVPWLYFETYFYRCIFGAFYASPKLKDYDYFAKFKHEALEGSINAVSILIDSAAASEQRDLAPTALKQATRRLVEISLWGNRCDLSLSCGVDASSQADALQKTDTLRSFIISNHTDKLMEHLWKLRERNLGGKKPTRLHCVVDSSGYELCSDFVLFDFLHIMGYVTGVTIHAKAIPYYVSDVMRRDMSWTLRKMQKSEHESMRALAE
ncbi:hypothetical protein HPB51_011090 [Rhipicephalus microplus]|uniref:Sugar phosphate phosphatase n=1 Tax=Rhipicephalus microplus TaxID=6941 RepID=A0A9J6DU92_RHIMP|nr:hypothetical protein HPB51_011090 [Rhipicephalus microplus]